MFKRLGIKKLAYWPVVLAMAGALACGGGEEEAEDAAQNQRGGRPGMRAPALPYRSR